MSTQPRFTHSPVNGRILNRGMMPDKYRRDYPITVWEHNPWTGGKRHAGDVKSDPQGRLIYDASWGPLTAATARCATDSVNHPPHYTAGGIECIDALEAATHELTGIEAVCTANAIKYLWRWKAKNGHEDLRKARWYINKLLGDTP